MNTSSEFKQYCEDLQFYIERTENIRMWGKMQSIIDYVVKNAKLFLMFLDVLAKYFYKDGKLYAPNPLKFWIYFKLAVELYEFFKRIGDEKSIQTKP